MLMINNIMTAQANDIIKSEDFQMEVELFIFISLG